MTQRKNYTADDDPVTYAIIGCAIRVHRKLGPGLVESLYEECMNVELLASGLVIARQPRLPVSYEGALLHREFRPDFLVSDEVVVELKSVSVLLPVHEAQLLTYMKLCEIERGLLLNFNVALMKDGIKRLIMTKAPSAPL